jgi:hypothetical protein
MNQCSNLRARFVAIARAIPASGLALSHATVFFCLATVAEAATPHSYPKQCGMPDGPACPAPAPIIGPWVYTLNFGSSSPPPIHSDAQVIQYHKQYYTSAATHWCTDVYTGTTSPSVVWGHTPAYQFGIMIQDSYVLHFNDTGYQYDGCGQSWTSTERLSHTT